MAAIISSSGIACLSLTMFYRTGASVPAVRDQNEAREVVRDQKEEALKAPFSIALFSVGTVVAMGVYEGCSHHVGGFALFALPAVVPYFFNTAYLLKDFTE